MKILGIETSCDETAAAVVKNGSKIVSNIVASSAKLHEKTGGIIPEEAARQQIKTILPVVNEALNKAQIKPVDIDTIAITIGPGLIGSLLVGVETAKTLSYLWGKPIIPVNHLVGHLYANWLENSPPSFPALGLVVSGGHTDLVLMKEHGKITRIGGTRDDAAGEAFDKCARIIGLGYPGGPAISNLADRVLSRKDKPLTLFPRPMIREDNFEWSFSGLKTSVLNKAKQQKDLDKEVFSAEIQEAIVDVLVTKSIKAIKKYRPKSFLLAGGVAANLRLREKFEKEIKDKELKVSFHVPSVELSTDNASYIAAMAYFNQKQTDWKKITANPQLTITQ